MSGLLIEHHPVHAEFIGGEIKSSNIAFEDYARMSTHTCKLAANRRYGVPAWALSLADLAAVIAHSMERRTGLRKFLTTLSTNERLEAAQKIINAQRPALTARLDKLCKEYVGAKDSGDHERADALQIQIENIDTQLVMLDRVAAILAGVVYFYWRCGFDSVKTGQELHIKPTHVRQILCRLVACATRLQYPPGERMVPLANLAKRRRPCITRVPGAPMPPNHVPAGLVDKVLTMRREGMFTVAIARELDLGPNGCEIVTRIVRDMEVPTMPVALQEESNPGYKQYVAYCTRMGVVPSPLIEWAVSTDFMLGDHGLRNKSITSYGQQPASAA